MSKRTEYSIGQYSNGVDCKDDGVWYVERKSIEIVALARGQCDAEAVAKAMKGADDANPS